MAKVSTAARTEEESGVVAAKPARVIAQATLKGIVDLQLSIAGMEKTVEGMRQELEGMKLGVLHDLKRGRRVEKGALAALLRVIKGRRTPRWKEVVAERLGPEVVEQVVAQTEPSPDRETIEVVGSAPK